MGAFNVGGRPSPYDTYLQKQIARFSFAAWIIGPAPGAGLYASYFLVNPLLSPVSLYVTRVATVSGPGNDFGLAPWDLVNNGPLPNQFAFPMPKQISTGVENTTLSRARLAYNANTTNPTPPTALLGLGPPPLYGILGNTISGDTVFQDFFENPFVILPGNALQAGWNEVNSAATFGFEWFEA